MNPRSSPPSRSTAHVLDRIAASYGSVDDALCGHDEPLDLGAVAQLIADAGELSPAGVEQALRAYINQDGFAAG